MLKDLILETLASQGANVAQFASFGPDGQPRYARIRGHAPGTTCADIASAICAIHATQPDTTRNVNIRTFLPEKPDGNPFLYGPDHGFSNAETAASAARSLIAQGYHVIVNETINSSDGGFSGVLHGDRFEFASRDVPRCVEKPGCAALPRAVALALVRTVHRFDVCVPFTEDWRVECSVHPTRVGFLGEQQVVWQAERLPASAMPTAPRPQWPNRYSRDMGDKAFGLLIAHLLGFPVPRTRVFGRIIPYFSFGEDTGNGGEAWLRTCPREQQPGLFTTARGWMDPYALMQKEDPDGTRIASVIVQDGVRSAWSGAAATAADGSLIGEGTRGYGDGFMQGGAPSALPNHVTAAVAERWNALRSAIGDARFEWAHDGERLWVLQLHADRSASTGDTVWPGSPALWRDFPVTQGLEALRELAVRAASEGFGIRLVGEVGVTSHFGDILRRAQVPSVLVRK